MILIQNLFSLFQVVRHARTLVPRNRHHPVKIVAHHGGFCRHRAHIAQFLEFGFGLFLCLFGHFGFVQLLFEFRSFVLAVFTLAQFFLNGFKLLIQIVLALGFFHLAFDAVTDLLFDLQHTNFGFHEPENTFQTVTNKGGFQKFLFFGNLKRQVRCNRVSKLRRFFDLIDRNQDFWRNFLVEFDVLFELCDHRTGKGLEFAVVFISILTHTGMGLEEFRIINVSRNFGAFTAFDQYLYRTIRQLEKLQNSCNSTNFIEIFDCRIIKTGVFLCDKQDLLVFAHDIFERTHRLFASHKQGDNHVREHDNVAQRQHRIYFATR